MSKHEALTDLIYDCFDRCGASVTNFPGIDFPDFVVGFAGTNELVRILSPWNGDYCAEWDANWNGHVTFIRSTSDVLPLLEKMAKRNWGKVK